MKQQWKTLFIVKCIHEKASLYTTDEQNSLIMYINKSILRTVIQGVSEPSLFIHDFIEIGQVDIPYHACCTHNVAKEYF